MIVEFFASESGGRQMLLVQQSRPFSKPATTDRDSENILKEDDVKLPFFGKRGTEEQRQQRSVSIGAGAGGGGGGGEESIMCDVSDGINGTAYLLPHTNTVPTTYLPIVPSLPQGALLCITTKQSTFGTARITTSTN